MDNKARLEEIKQRRAILVRGVEERILKQALVDDFDFLISLAERAMRYEHDLTTIEKFNEYYSGTVAAEALRREGK